MPDFALNGAVIIKHWGEHATIVALPDEVFAVEGLRGHFRVKMADASKGGRYVAAEKLMKAEAPAVKVGYGHSVLFDSAKLIGVDALNDGQFVILCFRDAEYCVGEFTMQRNDLFALLQRQVAAPSADTSAVSGGG